MEDFPPIGEYDGFSETPIRIHHSSRYKSNVEGKESIPP